MNVQLNDETGRSAGYLSFKGLDSKGMFLLNGMMGVEGLRYVLKEGIYDE